MQEIKRPISRQEIENERLRQHLSSIEKPTQIQKRPSKREKRVIMGVILAIVILILAAYFVIQAILRHDQPPVKSDWQAVFLTDGQVYFGKVVKENDRVVVLQNIYYLQEPGILQQGRGNLSEQGKDISLIKLGSEIHGPYDEMRINQAQVLFIEDLKEDSKVVKAIKEYVGK